MRRSIFIGSSSEALKQAKLISKLLSSVPGIVPILWKKAFPLGALTFEAIEALAHQVVGAVFLATPDDWAMIRDQRVRIPRTNVVLEWGYLTAVLGRNRVVICEYDGVSLPADVKNLTTCRMGPFSGTADVGIPSEAKRIIRSWATDLPSVAKGQPLTRVLHGYTGNWAIRIDYKVWQGIALGRADRVHFQGDLQLIIWPGGHRGNGLLYGKVFIHVKGCTAVFRLTDIEVSVRAQPNGSVVMISESYTRQLEEPIQGKRPQHDGFVERLPDPNRFEMRLTPTQRGTLIGEHQTLRGRSIRSRGVVMCEPRS
jgi:hypothetical protein